MRGIWSGRAPYFASCASSHPTQSNNGNAVDAVVVEMTPSPAIAQFATAGADQYPFASGYSPASHCMNAASSPLSAGLDTLPVWPRSSPYSRPGLIGTPSSPTAHSDGTIDATATPRGSMAPSASSAARGPSNHACLASCSNRCGDGVNHGCGMRARATTLPSSSAATALTDDVPMSMPTVVSRPIDGGDYANAASTSSCRRAFVHTRL